MWLIFRADVLMAAGVITIYAGLASIVVGLICLAIYLWRNWRSSELPRRRLVWQTTLLIALFLANFVAASGFVYGAIMIETRYHLSITNGGKEPLQDVRVRVGTFGVDFGDIPAGETRKKGFWIEGEGELVLTATQGGQQLEAVADGYVTPNLGGDVEVTVNPSGEVVAEDQRSGLASRSHPSSANTPQEMFQYTIQNPVPSSVTNLQGVGDTWQGYSLYLRFNASKADIDAIIAQGFKPAAWTSISYRFDLPAGYDRFTPDWNPASISTNECYELDSVKNGWTHSGTHYLVVDRSAGTVYFYGIGA
jgi:hypothetical protein